VLAALSRPDRREPAGPDDPPLQVQLRSAARAVALASARALHVASAGRLPSGLAAIKRPPVLLRPVLVTTLLLYTEEGAIGLGFAGPRRGRRGQRAGRTARRGRHPRRDPAAGDPAWVTLVFAVAAVVEIAFGLPFTHAFFLVAAFFLGFAAQASKICIDTLLQESVEDDFRGRVFSFYDTLFNLSFVAAAAASAVLLPPDGKSYLVIGIIAGGYAVTALGYGLLTARAKEHEPPEPIVVRG
jgi:hypothetical protein